MSSYLEGVVWYSRLLNVIKIFCAFVLNLNLRGGVSCMPAALLFCSYEKNDKIHSDRCSEMQIDV